MHRDVINRINNGDFITEQDFYDIAYRHCKKNLSLICLNDLVIDNNLNCFGVYDDKSEILTVSYDIISEKAREFASCLVSLYRLSQKEIDELANFFYLVFLLRELRHVEHKYIHDFKSSLTPGIEMFLYEFCESLRYNRPNLYNDNLSYIPTELDAMYHGLRNSYEIFKDSNYSNKIKAIMRLLSMKIPILKYEVQGRKIIAPIDRIINLREIDPSIVINEQFIKMLTDKDIPLDMKISYGLRINRYEYQKCYDETNKVRKLIK